MKRRAYLGALGVSTVTLAGCTVGADSQDRPQPTATGSDGVTVTVTKAPVNAGEMTSIFLEASSAGRMRFTDVPDYSQQSSTNGIEFRFDEADFTPSPETVWEAYPPTWEWSSGEGIEGEIPVRIGSEMPSGSYPFTVASWSGDFEEKKTVGGEIVVEAH